LGELPIAYMLRVMRDQTAEPKRRDAMALAAAPFCHPKLQAISQIPSLDLALLSDTELNLLKQFMELRQDGLN
jgi:hypothetical protein